MGQITIIKRDGTQINLFRTEPFCTVSQAAQNFTLMGDDNVQLTIQSAEIMDFSIGDKILIGGDEYSIRTKVNREIIGESRFTYEVTFYGVMYDLMKTVYRDTDINGKSTKSTFDLTYNLSDLVMVIIYNLNRDYPGVWGFDAANCPVTEPKTFSFSKQNCLQVLQNSCNEYGYEFRIDLIGGVRTIKIGKFGSVVTPPAGNAFFEWGKGAGLYKLKEQKVDDRSIITRLWIEGGTENIKSGYRNYSDRLQLPMRRLNNHAHTLSNGTVIPAQSEYIGITDDDKRYIEDEDLKNKLGSIEDVEQYDIHPARTGEVTALGDTIYSFVDSTMDFDLNEKGSNGTKWLIAETSAKITFITGKLAGQQFEMKEYNHSSKAFTIIKNTDERGLSVPTSDSEAFRFVVGDKYKITDINLPDAYVDDAEENLWYAGYDDFHLNRKLVRAQYVLTFDRSYFINALPADSETSVFRVGDYVPVKDVRFNLEKNIRIQKLSRNLLLEHDYTLTISDITTVPIATQIVQEVLEHEIIIEANRLRDTAKARRAWRTTEELRNMVYDTDGYFDSENIKPNSIDTNMLTVGSKSQQFILMNIVLEANVNGLPNRFDVSAGALIHLTIDDSGAKIWNMTAASVTLAESGSYYVFAKCSKSGNQGVFYITQQQIKVEPADDPNNYYFQVGIIGSLHVDDNFRDFTTTYGFTRINGNTITTGKIVTSDGECYLDLDGNKFRIGDANSALTWANGQLILKGTMVQNQSGDISHLAVFRSEYNNDYIYYNGDEVTYNNSTEICTYRYINSIPGKGQLPTNTVYWAVIAKGSKGNDGAYFEYRYAKNGSTISPPSITVSLPNPSGWNTTIPVLETLEYLWCTIAKKTSSGDLIQNWSEPIRITPHDGDKGEKGDSPVMVFRGVYDVSKTYYGTNIRLDAVQYNGVYYIARIDAGSFTNTIPTNTSKWNTFGGQFDAIATNLLLTENANVGGLIFRNEKLISQTGYVGNSISNDFENPNFNPNIEIDGKEGNIYLNGFFASKFSTSYENTQGAPRTMNFIVNENTELDFMLPNDERYIGSILTIYINKNITGNHSVRVGSPVYGGIITYKGNTIMMLSRYKGTVIRLMATNIIENRMMWELINYDSKHFSIINLSGTLTIVDRSIIVNDRELTDLPSLFSYWDTI